MSTQLASKAATPLAPSVSRLEGATDQDFVLPRVHIFQGLPAEAKKYGKSFAAGDLINTLTGEKIAVTRFVPMSGYKQWIKWKEPRGSGFDYSFRNRAEVPADDLAWNGDEPPIAQEYINWVVLFEGADMPVILPFTKTSLQAGKTINTLEMLRTKGKKGPGFYRLEMKQMSNDQGEWVSPKIGPAGEIPPELHGSLSTWMDMLTPDAIDKAATAAVEQEATDDSPFNPDAV